MKTKFTRRQLTRWGHNQRQDYKNGLLSPSQIAKCEKLPGWYWEIDLKQKAIDQLNEILDRADERGSLPTRNSKDLQERRDAEWIGTKIQVKDDRCRGTFYPELEEIAKKRGYPNLFEKIDLVKGAIDQLNEILDRVDARGSLPESDSKDPQERKDARWIKNKKTVKSGSGRGIWYPELDQIIIERERPDLFGIRDLKQEAIDQLNEILDRADIRGSAPKQNQKDPQEVKDAEWIGSKRAAKKGKGKGLFYPELEKIAKKRGYPDLFKIRDLKQDAIKELKLILDRIEVRGHPPKSNSKDPQEVKDSRWIIERKRARKGLGSSIFYPELAQIVKEHGCPRFFEYLK